MTNCQPVLSLFLLHCFVVVFAIEFHHKITSVLYWFSYIVPSRTSAHVNPAVCSGSLICTHALNDLLALWLFVGFSQWREPVGGHSETEEGD